MRLSGGSIFGSSGSEKAMFVNDDIGGTFHVQFNPKEMSLDESASWKESEEFTIEKPLVEFERGKASSLSMELIFDTTDTGEDVRDKWTKKLAGFVSVNQANTGGMSASEQNKHPNGRPPRCTFKWGNFTFPAVVESVKTSFIMFGSDGNPLRAKVSIKLKERNEDLQLTGSGPGVTLAAPASAFGGQANSRTEAAKISVGSNEKGPSTAASQEKIGVGNNATRQSSDLSGVSTYTVQEGDTLSGIALELAIEFWWIAAANNVEDPMNLTPGDTLVIPPNEEVAEIFQHLPAEDNWYWGDYDPELNQDSDLADIFAIYDGSWDPFAEQELEDLGAETALEVGVGDQVSGEWAMSDYEGQAPEATEFEHGSSDSSDTFATSGGIAAQGAAKFGAKPLGQPAPARLEDGRGVGEKFQPVQRGLLGGGKFFGVYLLFAQGPQKAGSINAGCQAPD